MVHSALPNDDLAYCLGMQPKDLRKLCGRLKEDRLIAVHSRQELREGQQRPIHRDYYYIDFHLTIDAIKYRVWHLTTRVRDMYKPSAEKKDYYCPRCKSQWTQLEVLDNVSLAGEFLCHKCDHVLERDEVSAADRAGHERQSRLMAQVNGILSLLQQIDTQTIPQNDFQTAISHAVPVERDESIAPAPTMVPVKSETKPNLKGLKTEVIIPLEVSLKDDGALDSDRLAAERKAAQEAQNALPAWHTKSTVTGEMTALGSKEAARLATSTAIGATSLKTEEEDKKADSDIMSAQIAAAYASFQQEQQLAKLQPPSSEDEDDDEDDDDDFEDVGIGGSGIGASGVNTPSSSMSGAVNNGGRSFAFNGGNVRGNIKVEDDSGSSAPGTTAAGTPLPEYGRESPSKRVKLESGAPVAMVKPELDSDDDDDFEDV